VFPIDDVADDREKMFGAHIVFALLEEIFEENLTRASLGKYN